MVVQGVKYPSDFEAKKAMIETAARLEAMGCMVAGDGSLSMRVGPNAVWITVDGADKGLLKQDSFIRVDLNGKQMPGSRQVRVPETVKIHLQVYEQNPAIRAIIHAYPISAVALGAAGKSVSPCDATPALRRLGRITLVGGYRAQNIDNAAAAAGRTDSGVIIANDGCMMWGESLAEAFGRLQALEYYAKLARATGTCSISQQSGSAQSPCGSYGGATAAACDGAEGNASVSVSGKITDGSGYVAPQSDFKMEGLTAIVRPGEKLESVAAASSRESGYGQGHTPTGQEVCSGSVRSSAGSQAHAGGTGVSTSAIRPAQVQTYQASQPVKSANVIKREKTMAEVVRRSLAAL
jgi:L-fuculose-phosphate aldolase